MSLDIDVCVCECIRTGDCTPGPVLAAMTCRSLWLCGTAQAEKLEALPASYARLQSRPCSNLVTRTSR
jgi:hypothetical protein